MYTYPKLRVTQRTTATFRFWNSAWRVHCDCQRAPDSKGDEQICWRQNMLYLLCVRLVGASATVANIALNFGITLRCLKYIEWVLCARVCMYSVQCTLYSVVQSGRDFCVVISTVSVRCVLCKQNTAYANWMWIDWLCWRHWCDAHYVRQCFAHTNRSSSMKIAENFS